MDCSRVIQNFDSLWFYTNIIVSDGSFTDDQTEANDDAPFPLTQKNYDDPKKVFEISSLIPRFCAKCGRVSNDSKADDEIVKSKSNDNSDDDEEVLKSRREREKKMKKERKKRRKKKNRRGVHHGIQQQIEKILPPFDDVAMKEHLKLWAYAVGKSMHCQMRQYRVKCD